MGIGRIIVLVVAAIAAIGAVYLLQSMSGTNAQSGTAIEPTIIEEPTNLVLVASDDIVIGQRVTPEQLQWLEWPQRAVNDRYLTKEEHPDALENYSGAIARVPIAKNEPVNARKLINSGEAGFMAAVLSAGMRAVAVAISVETGAGGFILPNDRVDIILTRELDLENSESANSIFVSDTIFKNVRVLAIDQTYSELDDEKTVIGATATLELNGDDSQLLAMADASGNISLALRSIADASFETAGQTRASGFQSQISDQVKVYKYGKSNTQAGLQ